MKAISTGSRAAALAGFAAFTAGAYGDITLLSRHSEAEAAHRDAPANPPGSGNPWTDFASTDAFGSWTVTLEHGYEHSDYATESSIGGAFVGMYRGGSPVFDEADVTAARQSVVFSNDTERALTIDFTASCRPCWSDRGFSPNLQFVLVSQTTGLIIFNLFEDGTPSGQAPYLQWAQQTWTGSLPPGRYELIVNADYAEYEMMAGQSLGAGEVAFSMTFGEGACGPDFNLDGFIDFFDYGAFVDCFEGGECPPDRTADYNDDDFVDFFDYTDFVTAFEAGC